MTDGDLPEERLYVEESLLAFFDQNAPDARGLGQLLQRLRIEDVGLVVVARRGQEVLARRECLDLVVPPEVHRPLQHHVTAARGPEERVGRERDDRVALK